MATGDNPFKAQVIAYKVGFLTKIELELPMWSSHITLDAYSIEVRICNCVAFHADLNRSDSNL